MKDHQTTTTHHDPSELAVQNENVVNERDEYLNGWKRALADFENFKRDTQTRIQDARIAERIKFVREILPIIDTLEQAIAHVPNEQHETGWFRGLTHVHSQWIKFMHEHNIDKIHTVGDPFDPTIHEAIQIENRPDKLHESVLAVVQPGYRLESELIRPAQVTVNMLPKSDQ